jgi:hypothetical protein
MRTPLASNRGTLLSLRRILNIPGAGLGDSSMTRPEIIERIRAIAIEGISHPDAASLLHAYIACLSVPDLCLAITQTLADSTRLRLALRRRLERLLRDGDLKPSDRVHIHDLVDRCRALGREAPSVRPVVEALLSAVFEFLELPQQQSIM